MPLGKDLQENLEKQQLNAAIIALSNLTSMTDKVIQSCHNHLSDEFKEFMDGEFGLKVAEEFVRLAALAGIPEAQTVKLQEAVDTAREKLAEAKSEEEDESDA